MPATATFTATAIIVSTNDGERRVERAFNKLSCFGRVIEDVEGLGIGEKILSIVHQTGESLISISNNPSLYPGNTIDGKTDFDAAKDAVFDSIGLSSSGGGGGGGGGLTEPQTRNAVRDGLDASNDIEAIKTNPIAIFTYKVTTAHGTAPNNFIVGQKLREFVKPDGNSVWRNEGSATDLTVAPVTTNLELTGSSSVASGSAAVIDWRVEVAHAGLPVGLQLREYPLPGGTSQWYRKDTNALLTTPPVLANLSSNFDAIVNAVDNATVPITSNQLTLIGLLGRMVPSDSISEKGTAPNQAVTLTVPKGGAGQRNVLTRIAAGYTGGTMPANNAGGNLDIDWGDGFEHYATLIDPGVTILMQSDNGEKAINVADASQTSTVGQIQLRLSAVPGCIGEITVSNRVEGSVNVPAPRTAADVYIEKAKLILSPSFVYYPGYTGFLWDAKRASDSVIEQVSANEDIATFVGSQTVTVARVYEQTPAARHHTPYGQEPLAYVSGNKVAWGNNQIFDFDSGRGLQNITGITGTSFIVIAVVNQARNTDYHQVMDGIAKRSGSMLDPNTKSFHPSPVYPTSYRIDGVQAALPSDPFPANFLTNTPHILCYTLNSPDLSGGTLMGTYTGGSGGGGRERQGTTMILDGSTSESDLLLVFQDIATKYGITLP